MVVGLAEYYKSPLLDFSEDIEEDEEQVGCNLVIFQESKGGLAHKWCS